MKTVGLILTIVGVLALLIGLGVVVNALTTNNASSTCAKSAADESKYAEARRKCNSLYSDEKYDRESRIKDCLQSETIRLTHKAECERATDYMTSQLIKGSVVAVIGALIAIAGFFIFFIFRRKKAMP